MAAAPTAFEPRGAPPPAALSGARVELHWAAQAVAAAGRALNPPVPDDSHTSLEWVAAGRLLVGIAPARQLRLGLRPAELALVVVDAMGNSQRELPLAGRTLDEALAWAAASLGAPALAKPPYEMPDHEVARGGAFRGDDPDARAELARWYATADSLLRGLDSAPPDARRQASPVRCWPHHFDIATLVTVPPVASAGTHTIGVGLSPGDAGRAEPYFYVTPSVTPSPYPESLTLPELPAGGDWNRTPWFGAVLTGTAIFSDLGATASTRAKMISGFLDAAIRASAALRGA
jgi:hypothetical protein